MCHWKCHHLTEAVILHSHPMTSPDIHSRSQWDVSRIGWKRGTYRHLTWDLESYFRFGFFCWLSMKQMFPTNQIISIVMDFRLIWIICWPIKRTKKKKRNSITSKPMQTILRFYSNNVNIFSITNCSLKICFEKEVNINIMTKKRIIYWKLNNIPRKQFNWSIIVFSFIRISNLIH